MEMHWSDWQWRDREDFSVPQISVDTLILREDRFPEIDYEGMEAELDSIAVRGVN